MALYDDFVTFFKKHGRRVDKIVDTSTALYIQGINQFDKDVPIVQYESRELLSLKAETASYLPMLASVVAEEQELPNETPYSPLSAEALGNIKIGLQHVFLARQYERLFQLNQMDLNPQVRAAIERAFIGMAADLVPSIIALSTRLIIEILTTGQCLYRDPRTSELVRLLYPTDPTIMLAPLAGNLQWTAANAATANGVQDLIDHVNAYYVLHGSFPNRLYIRRSLLLILASQESFKRAYIFANAGQVVQAGANVAGVPALSDATVISTIKTLTGIEDVQVFDARYVTRGPDGRPQINYYLPATSYMLLSEGIAERSFVPTIERNFEKGFYVRARVINDAPRQERIAGVGNYVPFLFDSKKIAARKVA